MSNSTEIPVTACRICFKEDETVVNRLSRLHKSIIFKLAQIQFHDHPNIPHNICKDCLHRLLEANYFRDLLLESNQTFACYEVEIHKESAASQKPECKITKKENVQIESSPNEIKTEQKSEPVPEPMEEEEEIEILIQEDLNSESYSKQEQSESENHQVECYPCCMCPSDFNSEENLLIHCQTEHIIQPLNTDPDEFQCRWCCSYFESDDDLINHKTCENCVECFASFDDLNEHLKSHDQNFDTFEVEAVAVARQLEDQEVYDTSVNEIEIKFESRKTKMRSPLNNKKGRKMSLDPKTLIRAPTHFYCCLCPNFFTSENERKRHMSSSHQISIVSKFDVNNLNCAYCKRKFDRVDQYYNHFEAPTRKLHVCTKCNRNFLTSELLQQHDKNIHSSEVPSYTCQACNINFATANSYYSHNHRHHTVKAKYKCDICSAILLTPSKLKEHRNVHLNIKDFVCSFCEKTFVRKDNLRNHLRTHTGDKPYKCEYCSKQFGHYTDMKRHRYTHTGDYPFKCPECGKGFIKLPALQTHLKFTKYKPHTNKSKHDVIIKRQENVVEITDNKEMKEMFQVVMVDDDEIGMNNEEVEN
uniref:CSON014663 protein n=1 Tax=Culicoides sonorensis TaxID=179676 RepID=A0A336MF79_CULSO